MIFALAITVSEVSARSTPVNLAINNYMIDVRNTPVLK